MEEREAEGFFRTTGKVLFFFAMVFCSVPFFVRRRAENGAAADGGRSDSPFRFADDIIDDDNFLPRLI